jgi:hypothetical protein
MATLTSFAARAADNFFPDSGIGRPGFIGIIIGFFVITLLSNLCGIRVNGFVLVSLRSKKC